MKRTINLIWDLQSFLKYKEQIVKIKKEHEDTIYENAIDVNIPLQLYWEYEKKDFKFTTNGKKRSNEIFYLKRI